jgi:CRP/FNR family transcriptional regulator
MTLNHLFNIKMFNAKRPSRECGECPIRQQAICSRCHDDELALLDEMKSYRQFKKGQAITYAGQDLNYLGTLVSGVAALSKSMEDGRRQIMGILLPSDFIGRPDRLTAEYDITAATDVLMCLFERTAFQTMLKTSPALGPRLLEKTMDELDAAREWLLLLGRKSAREKMATLLYLMAAKMIALNGNPATQNVDFEIPLTRETIADYLGLTVETVSRQITALKKDGIIRLRGQRHVEVSCLQTLMLETGDGQLGKGR